MTQSHEGSIGQNRSKMYLREKNKKEQRNNSKMLQNILENEPSACKANQMNKLLQLQWSETPNAYKIYSKIDDKRDTRIKNIMKYDGKRN